MLDYQSEYLGIKYSEKEKLLLPQWTGRPMTPDLFISEMKSYMALVCKTDADKVIWNHQNFTFQIPENLYPWIESEVNKPAREMGMKKIGFVLGEDVLAQFSTMDSFEQTRSILVPRYFADPEKALNWISKNEKLNQNPFEKELELLIQKDLVRGTAKIQIEVSLEQLPYYMRQLKDLFNHQVFVHKNYKKFMLLTAREKEILAMVMNGYSSKEIAERLYISVYTIMTHRRNILKKLECKNVADLSRYTVFIHL